MVALSLTLFAASVAAEPSSHILSDTPSYLNRAPILASFFSVDVDRNATSSACSGRGLQLGEPRHECHCNPGYSGVSCEHPGAAWSSGRLALSHTASVKQSVGNAPTPRVSTTTGSAASATSGAAPLAPSSATAPWDPALQSRRYAYAARASGVNEMDAVT